MKTVVKYALINSFGTAAYIAAIASFIFLLGHIFPGPDKETILAPIMMLMLLVFSAAFTGSLVLGRPILWYLNGKKKEALSLLIHTLGFLLIMIIIVFFLLVLFNR